MRAVRSPLARSLVVWVAAGAMVGWLVGFAWWLMLSPSPPSQPLTITIPRGAGEAIARGELVPGIPSTLELSSAGQLIVTNHDSREHLIAGTLVLPGDTALITPTNKNGQVDCSFHPAGAIDVSIDSRPPLYVTIFPAFLLGAPFGLAFGVANFVARRLSMEDDPVAPASVG